MKKIRGMSVFLITVLMIGLLIGVSNIVVAGASETALIIIDMQNDSSIRGAVPDAPYAKWGAKHNVSSHIKKALEFARQNNIFIVHVGVVFREGYPEATQSGFWAAIPGLGILKEGTWGAQNVKELKPELGPREIFITKVRTSSFHGTPLRDILIQRGITKLIITGGVVDSCVHHTVIDAVDFGFPQIAVLSDCIVASSDASYQVFCEETWPFHKVDVITLAELGDYFSK